MRIAIKAHHLERAPRHFFTPQAPCRYILVEWIPNFAKTRVLFRLMKQRRGILIKKGHKMR